MYQSTATLLILCIGAWIQTTARADAQVARGNPYVAESAPSSTVSPYLNLGVGPNGLSNYPSLVRPLLNQREQLARQATAAQRLRPRFGAPANANASSETPADLARQRRFLNYSHYYSGVR